MKKIHVPELDLSKLDINFREKSGEVNKLLIHPEKCCYGMHCGFTNSVDAMAKRYQKFG